MRIENYQEEKFKKILVIMISEILIFLIVSIFLSFYLKSKIVIQRKQILENQTKVLNIKSLAKSEIKLKNQYKIIEPYLDEVNNFLPDEENILEIVNWLENLAKSTNVKQTIKIKGSSPFRYNYKRINSEISISGNLDKFLDYLEKFENSRYFLPVKKLKVMSVSDINKSADFNFETSFTVKSK